jgi:hypothetical protein
MRIAQVSGLIGAILFWAGVANAQTTTITVQQTIDYTSNSWADGPWFAEPDVILDHSPFHRGSNEDWGWIHNVAALVPATAIGIESATLTIIAWDVDPEKDESDRPYEDDVVYVTLDRPPEPVNTNVKRIGTNLGLLKDYLVARITVPWSSEGQVPIYEELWSSTTFVLPANVLDDLWQYEQLYAHIDIDQYDPDGARVTVKQATLAIKYITTGTPPPQPGEAAPVHRFWSPLHGKHFYTADAAEKDSILATYPPEVWSYESVAFLAYPEGTQPAGTSAVYRFWSPLNGAHFYTIDAAEKDSILATYPPEVWSFESIAFYAYPEGAQPAEASAVHRFWSPLHGTHFYTIDVAEKDSILATYPPEVWSYEGVAFHAYTP